MGQAGSIAAANVGAFLTTINIHVRADSRKSRRCVRELHANWNEISPSRVPEVRKTLSRALPRCAGQVCGGEDDLHKRTHMYTCVCVCVGAINNALAKVRKRRLYFDIRPAMIFGSTIAVITANETRLDSQTEVRSLFKAVFDVIELGHATRDRRYRVRRANQRDQLLITVSPRDKSLKVAFVIGARFQSVCAHLRAEHLLALS